MKASFVVPAAALAGTLLIAGSFAWPLAVNRGPGSWTEEKAQRHAQTRAELHAASHQASHAAKHSDEDEAHVAELQARLDAELGELDAVRNRGSVGKNVLWWSGAALIAAAGGLHFLRREA